MTDPQWEPEQLEVGLICHVERRSSGGYVHRWQTTISRITARRAYLPGEAWFALNDPEREVSPRYIDYTTRVVRIERKAEQ